MVSVMIYELGAIELQCTLVIFAFYSIPAYQIQFDWNKPYLSSISAPA